MNKVFVEEEFLSDTECNYLINYYQSIETKRTHADTKLVQLSDDYCTNEYVKYLLSKLSYFAQTAFNNRDLYINFSHLVEWKDNSMPPHRDFQYHPCTSIVYLNQDYDGGETFIGDVPIIPKIGKIVCFNGDEIYHGVNKVSNGTRFTLTTWYTNGKFLMH